MTLNPFIIDCDTGRDDALAIWCALALDLPLKGIITSFGNTEIENVTDNTARVLALANREDIPLCAGTGIPSRNHRAMDEIVQPRQKKSGNGLCNIHLPPPAHIKAPAPSHPEKLANFILSLEKNAGKPLDYVIIGPASNFSAVCDILGEDIHKHVARVTMMGGKFSSLWDRIPGPDFNIACDPFAVQNILDHGYKVNFVPMNATWDIFLSLEDIEKLQAETAIARYAQEIMVAHCRHFAPEPVFRFHDPAVIFLMQNLSYFRPCAAHVICDPSSDQFGRLVMSEADENARVCDINQETRDILRGEILKNLGLRDF